jgi:putative effector of murein hydrolase
MKSRLARYGGRGFAGGTQAGAVGTAALLEKSLMSGVSFGLALAAGRLFFAAMPGRLMYFP